METSGQYLDGRMLVAMPSMGDARFERSVIYLCAHSKEGAMGIIVNQIASSISFRELLEQLDIVSEDKQIRLPADFVNRKVFIGGPVETGRGFVNYLMVLGVVETVSLFVMVFVSSPLS